MIRLMAFLFLALCLTLGPLAGLGEAAHAHAADHAHSADHAVAHGGVTADDHCDTSAPIQSAATQSCAACSCAAVVVGAAVTAQMQGISRVGTIPASSHDQVPMGLMAAPLPRPPRA